MTILRTADGDGDGPRRMVHGARDIAARPRFVGEEVEMASFHFCAIVAA